VIMISDGETAEFGVLLRSRRDALGDDSTMERMELDSALERLEFGNYGWCQACGRQVPHDELREQPAARLCSRCSSR